MQDWICKRIIQIAVVDKRGDKLLNKNISSSLDVLKKELARMPKDTQYVIESSSVWEGVYNCMVHDLGLDVILSNPYKTRLIAESKKKTDKVDAFILADMLRGGYIASCYVPDFETIDNRKLARYSMHALPICVTRLLPCRLARLSVRSMPDRCVNLHGNSQETLQDCADLKNTFRLLNSLEDFYVPN